MTLKAVSVGGDTAPCFPGFNSRRRLGESESDLSFTLRSGFRGDCYCPSSLRSPFPNWVSPPPTPHARGHPSSQPSLLSGGAPERSLCGSAGPPRTVTANNEPDEGPTHRKPGAGRARAGGAGRSAAGPWVPSPPGPRRARRWAVPAPRPARRPHPQFNLLRLNRKPERGGEACGPAAAPAPTPNPPAQLGAGAGGTHLRPSPRG